MITNMAAVTIFNGRTEKDTRRKIFIPTVIRGVSHTEAKGATVANNGVWSDDVQHKIRVPLSAAVQDKRTLQLTESLGRTPDLPHYSYRKSWPWWRME